MASPLAAGFELPELSPEAAISDFLNSLRRPTRLLVAVSGGSDSLGLLLSLKQALDARPYPHTHSLVAATVDHGLRPEAAAEARQVAALCKPFGIPHRIERWSGDKPASGLSAAAREARYRLLAAAADALQADAIVTGHTLDDQIETVAMRASRSAEAALGLAGMAPATLHAGRLWILRPLLRTRRSAIRTFLETQGQTWIDDPSNDDPRYERVRTRQSAPAIDAATIDAAARQRSALSAEAANWLQESARGETGMVVTLSLDAFGGPACDYALATLLAVLGGKPHRPGAASLKRLSIALQQGVDFRLTVAGTLVVRRRQRLFLVRERRGVLPLSLAPAEAGIWDGRYTIVNQSRSPIIVTAGPAREIDPSLPGSIRAALAGNAPQIFERNGISTSPSDLADVTPRLSVSADFLPLFDLPLTDAVAMLIGAERSPACPI